MNKKIDHKSCLRCGTQIRNWIYATLCNSCKQGGSDKKVKPGLFGIENRIYSTIPLTTTPTIPSLNLVNDILYVDRAIEFVEYSCTDHCPSRMFKFKKACENGILCSNSVLIDDLINLKKDLKNLLEPETTLVKDTGEYNSVCARCGRYIGSKPGKKYCSKKDDPVCFREKEKQRKVDYRKRKKEEDNLTNFW